MNPLEKKCVLFSASFHAALLLVVAFGSAFFTAPDPAKALPPLTFVPSKLVDEMIAPGGGNPNPAPASSAVRLPVVTPKPATAAPKPKPPKPQPKPKPEEIDPNPVINRSVAATEQLEKEFEIVEKPKRKPLKKSSDIVPTFDEVKPNQANRERDRRVRAEAERQAQVEAAARLNKFNQIRQGLESGLTTGLSLEPMGSGGVAYAYYGQEIMRRYEEAWRPVGQLPARPPTVQVQVTIRKDGAVVSQEFLSRSGLGWLDRSVQEALDRVRAQKLPPFPEGAKDTERSFILNFNPKNKQTAG